MPSFASNPATLGGGYQSDLVVSGHQAQAQETATKVLPAPQFCSTGPPASCNAVVDGPFKEFVPPAQTANSQSASMKHRQAEAISAGKLVGQVPQPLAHVVTDLQAQTSNEPKEEEEPYPGDVAARYHVQHPRQMAVSDAVVIELFAGSANLSKAFRSVGMQVIPVDTKDAPQIKIVKLNLLHQHSVQLVVRLLDTRKVLFVHMAPPCSTSSQARMIQRTWSDPKPLRSWDHPDGLPGLSFLDKTRVSQANKLYQVCFEIAEACSHRHIWWSIENPTGSFMWVTTPFQVLWTRFRDIIRFATFHNCVYGGDRKKSTALWTSCSDLQGLSCVCSKDFDHVHAAWGKQRDGTWATSKEAAYPPGLCSHIASLVLQAAEASGKIVQCQRNNTLFLTKAQTGFERAAQGLFPRGSQMPPLVDPFPNKIWHQVPPECDRSVFVPGKRLSGAQFPKGSTTLAVAQDSGAWWAQVGVPVTPKEFLTLSGASQHPESRGPVLPPVLAHAVHKYCNKSPEELSLLRIDRLRSILARADELKKEEQQIHAKLQPHARDVLKGKRILLLRELLRGMNFPDSALTDDMQQGFRITGWLQDTYTRPTKVLVPTLNQEDLWSARHDNNHRMWGMCRPSGDNALDRALWQQTVKECESGWATLHLGLTRPPENSVLSRRFAVQQQDKVRPIDDFSVSQVNHTLGCVEKIMVMPSSTTVSLALALQQGLTANNKCGVSGDAVALSGKTFDLKSAYKQLPIHSCDLRFAQATVWNPDAQKPAVVSLKALPFGATGSVQGFCRCSVALWALVLHYIVVPVTVFFDDFTSVVAHSDSSSAEAAFILLMRVLGWKVAADKGQPYASLFQSLGISFLLPRSATDPVQVSNTDHRKKEIAASCLRLVRTGRVSPHECSVFAGRLRWMEGQTFGRLGRKFFRTILAAGDPPSDSRPRPMDPGLREAFEWILHNVPKAPPKCFRQPSGKTFQVFTDGSFESQVGCMAGVLCQGNGSPWQFWRAKVPPSLVGRWLQEGVQHPIMQCELLAAAVSLAVWGPVLSGSHVTLWIDNDAARHGIIAAQAYPRSNMLIVQACLAAEVDFGLGLWIARVPSISNPADAPSRGELPAFLESASEIKVEVGMIWRLAEGLPAK